MIIKTTSLAFAAACLMTAAALPPAHAQMAGGTELVTNGPQTDLAVLVGAAKRNRQPTL